MEKPYWEGKEYSYFSHKKCEFFPCHKNADPDDFNCLFCYCPLYALGEKCGGNFRYTEKGIKDCTNCMLPHKRKNYGYVTGKYQELLLTNRQYAYARWGNNSLIITALNNDDNETILNIPVPIQAQTAVDLLNSDNETCENNVLPVQNGRLEIKLKGNWGAVLKIKGEN